MGIHYLSFQDEVTLATRRSSRGGAWLSPQASIHKHAETILNIQVQQGNGTPTLPEHNHPEGQPSTESIALPVLGLFQIRSRLAGNLVQHHLDHAAVSGTGIQEPDSHHGRRLHDAGDLHVCRSVGEQRGKVEGQETGEGRAHGPDPSCRYPQQQADHSEVVLLLQVFIDVKGAELGKVAVQTQGQEETRVLVARLIRDWSIEDDPCGIHFRYAGCDFESSSNTVVELRPLLHVRWLLNVVLSNGGIPWWSSACQIQLWDNKCSCW